MSSRVGPLAFLAAALVRLGLLVSWGGPPRIAHLDVNNYLELALNLWRDGTYGSVVSTDYPPLYPMVIAPAFALADNDLRFAAIFALHGLLLSVGSLALLPLLRTALGERSAWLALAASQLLAGATFHALSPRSEVLFTALVLLATGAVFGALQRGTARRWALVGLVCGLAVACRRMGLVLPLAAAGVLVVEARAAAPGMRLRRAVRPALALGAGLAAGGAPELLAMALHGDTIQTYHEGVVASHLAPVARVWSSPRDVFFGFQTILRQLLYPVGAFAGAPLVAAALLFEDLRRKQAPRSLAGATAFALATTVGLGVLASLHILRYAFSSPDVLPWHIYPRYLDPAEPAILLAAVGLAGWRWARLDAPAIEVARRALYVWIVPAAVAVWASGYVWRYRGSRVPPRHLLEGSVLEHGYYFFFPLVMLGLLLGLAAWWRTGRYGSPATVLLAVALGWALSWHVPGAYVPAREPVVPSILQVSVLRGAPPNAPLAVLVPRGAENRRGLYEPAFRTDHDVYWSDLRSLPRWLYDHPGGFVLTRSGEPDPDRSVRLELVGATPEWRLWAPRGRESIPADLLESLRPRPGAEETAP